MTAMAAQQGAANNAVAVETHKATAAEVAAAAETSRLKAEQQAAYDLANPMKKKINNFLDFVNSDLVQTVLYLTFVVIFQALTSCLRRPEEFYLDK